MQKVAFSRIQWTPFSADTLFLFFVRGLLFDVSFKERYFAFNGLRTKQQRSHPPAFTADPGHRPVHPLTGPFFPSVSFCSLFDPCRQRDVVLASEEGGGQRASERHLPPSADAVGQHQPHRRAPIQHRIPGRKDRSVTTKETAGRRWLSNSITLVCAAILISACS